jgi:hypothetical protein
MLPPDVESLAPYGRGVTHPDDRRHLLAFPRGRSRSAFGATGRLGSVEGRRSWTLRIRDRRPHRWRIDAALGTLRRPFEPCRVALDGRPLRHWRYDPAGRILRVAVRAPARATLSASGC